MLRPEKRRRVWLVADAQAVCGRLHLDSSPAPSRDAAVVEATVAIPETRGPRLDGAGVAPTVWPTCWTISPGCYVARPIVTPPPGQSRSGLHHLADFVLSLEAPQDDVGDHFTGTLWIAFDSRVELTGSALPENRDLRRWRRDSPVSAGQDTAFVGHRRQIVCRSADRVSFQFRRMDALPTSEDRAFVPPSSFRIVARRSALPPVGPCLPEP